MHDDEQRWNARYAATATVEAGAPEAVERWPDLVAMLPAVGRGIDIASGPGAVTLWLAERGLDVTAVDASSVAIDLLKAAAAAAGTSERIEARRVDLDDGLPDDLDDLDVIVCQRFRDPKLYAPMIDRLGVGGVAIVTVLSAVGATEPGPFHAPAGELSTTFGADERCETLRSHEGDGVAHIVVRRR